MGVVALLELHKFVENFIQLLRFDRRIHVAHFQVTLDVVLVHSLADKINRFKTHLVNGSDSLLANLLNELLRTVTNPPYQLATITPGSTPAYSASLNHGNTVAALGQLQGRGNTGKATAHNTNVYCLVISQLRVVGDDVFGRRVIGVGMGSRVHRSLEFHGRVSKAIQVDFSSVYLARACSDLSRPLPDCLKPPKGTVISPPW